MHIPFLSSIMRLTPIKRQSTLSLGFTILITIVGFFSTMLFSHLLGKDLMGVYYLFITYFSIFNLIGDGGFQGAAVKRISEGHNQNEYFSAYIFLRALLIIISTIILISIEPLFVDLSEYQLIPLIIISMIIAFFAHGITGGVCGLGHIGVINAASGISELIRIAVSVILVLIGFSFYGMIGGYIVALLLSGLLCIKYFKFKPAKFTKHHIWSLLTFSFWGLLIGSSSLLMTYSDTIFIGYFMENGDVGVYRTAMQFTSISVFIVTAINSTLGPKISNWSYNGEIEKIPPVISRSFTYGLILAIPMAVGGFLLAERLLYYFYGADFASGAAAACIIFLFQIVTVFLTFIGAALSNSNHPRDTFYGTLAAVILNVILDIILIPIIGINGAAVGSLIAMIVNTLIITHRLKKYMPVYVEKKPILHIILASLIMGAFVFIYKLLIPLDNVILTLIPVAIGGLIYFFLLFKLDKGIRNEIRDLVTNFGIPWPKWL